MIIQYLVQLPFGPEQYEYASVVPVRSFSKVPKRKFDGSLKVPDHCHMRWLQSSGSSTDPLQVKKRREEIETLGETVSLVPQDTFLESLQGPYVLTWADAPNYIFKAFDEHLINGSGKNPTIGFTMLFGDSRLGAVFATQDEDDSTEVEDTFTVEDISDAFSQKLVSRDLLIEHFDSLRRKDGKLYDEFGMFDEFERPSGASGLPVRTRSAHYEEFRDAHERINDEVVDRGLLDDPLLDYQTSDDELSDKELSDENLSDEREPELIQRQL
ncbi:MAG: hypothetical protein Q9165_005865, partial [Trypethelium subeluteriae]